jgi:hypothetical protein
MNAMERLLHDEVTRFMDRLASSVPAGGIERVRVVNPTLKLRLDEMDSSLAVLRSSLVEGYGRWRRALDDLENLWALVAWRSAESEEATEKTAALAA